MIHLSALPQVIERATLFAHTLSVGYQKTEVSHLVATLAEATGGGSAARLAFVGKGKRTNEGQLHDWTTRLVILEGWRWPDLPERGGTDGMALYPGFDEGWNRSFDAYLERALAGRPNGLWFDPSLGSHSTRRRRYDWHRSPIRAPVYGEIPNVKSDKLSLRIHLGKHN